MNNSFKEDWNGVMVAAIRSALIDAGRFKLNEKHKNHQRAKPHF